MKARFMISSTESFDETDGKFSHIQFYSNIVWMIENMREALRKEFFWWINVYVSFSLLSFCANTYWHAFSQLLGSDPEENNNDDDMMIYSMTMAAMVSIAGAIRSKVCLRAAWLGPYQYFG
jgi:hypothetical protein